MLLLGKIMILQGVGHPISCLGVCYANDPKKGGYMTPAPALDLTTSLRGDLSVFWMPLGLNRGSVKLFFFGPDQGEQAYPAHHMVLKTTGTV